MICAVWDYDRSKPPSDEIISMDICHKRAVSKGREACICMTSEQAKKYAQRRAVSHWFSFSIGKHYFAVLYWPLPIRWKHGTVMAVKLCDSETRDNRYFGENIKEAVAVIRDWVRFP